MHLNARREALITGFAYHSLLKLDKSGKTQISPIKKVKTGRKGLPLTTRPPQEAIPDCFTGAVAHFCTFEARPPVRAIPPPSWMELGALSQR